MFQKSSQEPKVVNEKIKVTVKLVRLFEILIIGKEMYK